MPARHLVLFLVLFFAVLGVAWFQSDAVDVPVLEFARTLDHPVILVVGDWVALLGNGYLLVPGCLVVLWVGYRRQARRIQDTGRHCLLAFIGSGLGAQAIKHLLGRPRPRQIDDGDAHWGPSLESGFDSFPSGHATSAFAIATVLAFYYPRWRILFFACASSVAVARVIRHSHFVTDALAGALLGVFIAVLVVYHQRKEPACRQAGAKG